MRIMVVMQAPGMTAAQYETVRQVLGDTLPPGELLHLAGPIEGGWQIVEVWESAGTMQAFFQSEKLAEAVRVSGMTPAQPMISPVHTFALAGAASSD